jgi:hypothetical protein
VKAYRELTPDQQIEAVNYCLNNLLQSLLNGIRFNDELNGDNMQAAIDSACQEAEDMRTPWFSHEYIMDARYNPGEGHITEDDGLWPVAETLRGIASCTAEDALYSEPDEYVIPRIG